MLTYLLTWNIDGDNITTENISLFIEDYDEERIERKELQVKCNRFHRKPEFDLAGGGGRGEWRPVTNPTCTSSAPCDLLVNFCDPLALYLFLARMHNIERQGAKL